MTLEQILSDKNTFADNIEFTIGNEKVTLGGLRELSATQQKNLSDKIAAASSQENVARDTAMKAANLLAELQTAKETLSSQKTVSPTEDDFEKDNFWDPVRKRFSGSDKKIDDAIAKIDALTKAVTQTATIWAEDRWQSQYEKVSPRLKKVDQYKDWDYTKVRDYAAQNKILDSHGLPSLEKAVMELTKANDFEQVKKEAYEKGLQEGRTKARLETMPRPASASGGSPRPKGKSAVEEVGLEGLGDDVMGDPELAELAASLGDIQLQ
jgi:hypothetical protein